MAQAPVRLGIDIGGTFTDLVLVDDQTGAVRIAKVLTTPRNPAEAVEDGFRAALQAGEYAAAAVGRVVHGTTLVTNAVLERKGVKTALLTTQGFRDTLEIATEHRYDMYDLNLDKPIPLVPRRLRYEVAERTLSDGTQPVPLDPRQVAGLAEQLRAEGVQAVAVCLLHSYRNPQHEQQVREILAPLLPGIPITISAEVSPELREYHRSTTAVVNAYVAPLMDRYLEDLEQRLRATGFGGNIFLMLSNGGICTVGTARHYPVRLIESGPAAGALAASYLGGIAGHPNLLSFDMGGTTAKACIIEDAWPHTSPDFEVAHVYRFKKGSGFPLQIRSIEMIEIGAGGGSIAHVDDLGLLRVGPESAGSVPGPVCYGRGGTHPTVTDADLCLGYLDAKFFLGGKMALDRDGALAAIDREVAQPLGLAAIQAADAIHQVVNESMASAARVHAVERGKNPRAFPLFAFGGAGPVHAWGVARILGSPQVIVPLGAGVISAAGLLTAPLAFDFVRSYRATLDNVDWQRTGTLFREMESEGRAVLTRAGLKPEEIVLTRLCSARYLGQGSEVEVTIPGGDLGAGSEASIRAAFETQYRAQYNVVHAGLNVEVLTWRVIASGPRSDVSMKLATGDRSEKIKGSRPVYFKDAGGFLDTPVYDRYALKPGDSFPGPGIVEEHESTTVVGPDTTIAIDAHLNLILTLHD